MHISIGQYYSTAYVLGSCYCVRQHNSIDYYMLHPASSEISSHLLWWFIIPMGCIAYSFLLYGFCLLGVWFQIPFFVYGSNMALLINDDHIQYCPMDVVWSIQLGHSYFASTDYLAVTVWISVMIQHPNHVKQNGQSLYKYIKFFLRAVGHTSRGASCHCIVAMLNIFNSVVITVFFSFISKLCLTS